MISLILLPFRVLFGSTKLGYKTGRLVGYRRLFLLAVGVGIGLLVAPVPGKQVREKLRGALEGLGSGGGRESDLAERVRFELKHAPRTWHLPQPDVSAEGGTVRLRGHAPHETGRNDLERTAAAVAGVIDVRNDLEIAGTNGGPRAV